MQTTHIVGNLWWDGRVANHTILGPVPFKWSKPILTWKNFGHGSTHLLCLCIWIANLIWWLGLVVQGDLITPGFCLNGYIWAKIIIYLSIIHALIKNGASSGGDLQKKSTSFWIRPEDIKKDVHCIFSLNWRHVNEWLNLNRPYDHRWYSPSVLSVTPFDAPKTDFFHVCMNSQFPGSKSSWTRSGIVAHSSSRSSSISSSVILLSSSQELSAENLWERLDSGATMVGEQQRISVSIWILYIQWGS